MENASKALIIAGSVLMSLMIIAALVFMFMQISEIEQTKLDGQEVTQMSEYSKKFEQFNRVLYGSELLSLANLQEDYNKSQADVQGYTPIDIRITIKTAIIDGTKTYVPSDTLQDIKVLVSGVIKKSNTITNTSSIESDINYYEKKKYKGRTVKQYSQMSNREIANIYNIEFSSDEIDYDIGERMATTGEKEVRDLMKDIENYKNIKATYVEFKNRRFKCTDIDYDINGRVNKMYFTEI